MRKSSMDLNDILTLILSGFAFVFSLFTYIAGLLRQKKQDTIVAFNILQEQVLDKMTHYTKGRIVEISAHPRSDEYKELSALIARCEHFAVGVNSHIYDKKVVKRLSGKHFEYLYEKVCPIIEKKRSIDKSDKHYDEFEKMVKILK